MIERTGPATGLALAAVAIVVASCGGGGTTVSTTTVSRVLPAASTTTPTGATVVVAMGRLADPSNTFYELFDRPTGSSVWSLSTPPGVADNGGLVVGTSTTGTMTAGFLPSADLTFSVLAQRTPGATTWVPAEVPGTLGSEPDVLATGPTGRVAAVLVRPGHSVVGAGPGLTSWNRLTTDAQIDRASVLCREAAITAVGVTGSGGTVVGARCPAGSTVGLFVASAAAASGAVAATPGAGWSLIGPLAGPDVGGSRPSATTVIRLQTGSAGTVALVEGAVGGATSLATVWGIGRADPSGSAALSVPSGWSVLGSAVGGGSGGEATVLLGDASGAQLRVALVDGPASGAGAHWTELARPPADTAAVASIGAETDAFVVSGSHLSVWSTTTGATSWSRISRQSVPIQYGSSS